MISMASFILGAGIGGGAHNVAMLLAGRTIQGIGSAGLSVLSDVLVADLVPLRERAKYFSLVLSTAAVGTIVGPIIGGALAQASWRWCFYINLPLGAPSILLMFFFVRLKHNRAPTWKHALARVDWFGNVIFVPAITALVFGLVSGGQVYPWSSFRVILPLVLGAVGWICFHVYEASPVCKSPGVPPRLFNNRTTVAAFAMTFLAGILLNWVCYFLAFYFQAIWGATPVLSGVFLLPLLIFMIPSGGAAGGIMSKTSKYRRLHGIGFAMIALGVGLFSILRSNSSPAEWVFFQIFASIGLGFAMTTLLPAVSAGLEEKDVASATAVFSFLRTFGFVWGVTIPSIVFNNQFDAHLNEIRDIALRQTLSNGAAYSYAVSGAVRDLTGSFHDQVVDVYTQAVKYVWYIALAFVLLGFLIVFAEKHIPLRTELDTQYGLETKQEKEDPEAKAGGVEME